jgi:ABC-type Zn uptake system ZnuABC Zn-binding protein ZnuA
LEAEQGMEIITCGNRYSLRVLAFLSLVVVIAVVSCNPAATADDESGSRDQSAMEPLSLPDLDPAALEGDRLKVAATTSIIADVVANVGGDGIQLLTLMKPGQDPHAYEPTARELADVASVHVIFVNGWDLEEGLVDDLKNVAPESVVVPVSAGIEPLPISDHPDDERDIPDPHTWLDPHLVKTWVDNIERTLVSLDPDGAEIYVRRAASYQAKLVDLIGYIDEQVKQIPKESRKLVTNHDSLSYFAEAYDFQIIGLVIPAASTLAEPSSNDLVRLVDQMDEAGICTIFAETTNRTTLAETVTAELKSCDSVQVIQLHTGALGPASSEADTYLGMMETNIDAILAGLR